MTRTHDDWRKGLNQDYAEWERARQTEGYGTDDGVADTSVIEQDGEDVTEQRPDSPQRSYGKSAYLTLTGLAPKCTPNDRMAARMYANKLGVALAMTGWTDKERARLRVMRTKWTARAEGRDARFAVKGNASGNLTLQERARVADLKTLIPPRAKLQPRIVAGKSYHSMSWDQIRALQR